MTHFPAPSGTDICPVCDFKMCRCTAEQAEIPRIARPAFEALYERDGIKNFWRQYRFWPGRHAPLNCDWKLRKQSALPSIDEDGKTYHDPRMESHWQIYREGWLAGRERERELERCKAANAASIPLQSTTEQADASRDHPVRETAMTAQGALEIAANIAEAIDSGRGNEKQIAVAIRDVAKRGYWTRPSPTSVMPDEGKQK